MGEEDPQKGLRLLSASWWVRQQAGFRDLKVVVFGEVQAKVPGAHVVIAEIAVHHHTFDITQRGRHAPGRIGQMTARAWPARPKLAHNASQALSPITGPERLAILSHAQNENFFSCIRNHGSMLKEARPSLLHCTKIFSIQAAYANSGVIWIRKGRARLNAQAIDNGAVALHVP